MLDCKSLDEIGGLDGSRSLKLSKSVFGKCALERQLIPTERQWRYAGRDIEFQVDLS